MVRRLMVNYLGGLKIRGLEVFKNVDYAELLKSGFSQIRFLRSLSLSKGIWRNPLPGP